MMLSTPASWLDLARLINPAGEDRARRADPPVQGSVLDQRARARSTLA